MNDKEKIFDFACVGCIYDTVSRFYDLMTQADYIVSQENFDEFIDWLNDIDACVFKAKKRVDKINSFQLGVSA